MERGMDGMVGGERPRTSCRTTCLGLFGALPGWPSGDGRALVVVAEPKANDYIRCMIPRWLPEDEWSDWYQLTPTERWIETQKLWSFYMASGGSLDTEPDSQSPFDTRFTQRPRTADGGAGLRFLRRG